MRIFSAALLLLMTVTPSIADQKQLTPLIPPGYAPTTTADEQGLWTELEDYERAIQTSALRVRDKDINERPGIGNGLHGFTP